MHKYKNNGETTGSTTLQHPALQMYRAVTYCKTVGVGNGVGELWRTSRLSHHARMLVCRCVCMSLSICVCMYVCMCVYTKTKREHSGNKNQIPARHSVSQGACLFFGENPDIIGLFGSKSVWYSSAVLRKELSHNQVEGGRASGNGINARIMLPRDSRFHFRDPHSHMQAAAP